MLSVGLDCQACIERRLDRDWIDVFVGWLLIPTRRGVGGFKGLRQCADPFRWLLQNRGYEKKHHVSTVRACVVGSVGFDDFKWAYNSVFHLCPMSQSLYVIDF